MGRHFSLSQNVARCARAAFQVCVVVGLLVLPVGARAQADAVSGRVVDQTGQALPGVTVQIVSADRAISRTLTTDNDGRYSVRELPAGQYDVTFSAINFADLRRRHVSVTSSIANSD